MSEMEERIDNGSSAAEPPATAEAAVVDDEEPLIGPGPVPAPRARPKRPLEFEQAYLDSLPSANMYAYIYMRISGLSVHLC